MKINIIWCIQLKSIYWGASVFYNYTFPGTIKIHVKSSCKEDHNLDYLKLEIPPAPFLPSWNSVFSLTYAKLYILIY